MSSARRARFAGVLPVEDQPVDRGGTPRRDLLAREPEVAEPDDLALAHRNAAVDLREEFGEADLVQKLFGLAIGALAGEALGVVDQFAQALHIGREPGEPMGGVLIGLEQIIGDLAVAGVAGAHARERILVQRLDGGERLFRVAGPIGGFKFRRDGCGHSLLSGSQSARRRWANLRLTCRHLAGDATASAAGRLNFGLGEKRKLLTGRRDGPRAKSRRLRTGPP